MGDYYFPALIMPFIGFEPIPSASFAEMLPFTTKQQMGERSISPFIARFSPFPRYPSPN
jgi:hypothetical protein